MIPNFTCDAKGMTFLSTIDWAATMRQSEQRSGLQHTEQCSVWQSNEWEDRSVAENEPETPTPRKRADARRNEENLLAAAAAAFVASGVDVPVRDIAARAGVGVGTIYRHFPTRANLIVAVYRHQVEACADAGPTLLRESSTAISALAQWVDLFVDFLVTKHGLAGALQSQSAAFDTLHGYFIDRLLPVCTQLLESASAAGEIEPDVDAYGLMRGIGNVCIGADTDPNYDARRMVALIIAGLRRR
jgi:AcrR family transcriptional regulator